jgi:hypothetical protein
VKSLSPLRPLAAAAILVLGVFAAKSEATNTAGDREVVLEWNQALIANVPASAAVFTFRHHAMVHIAMFDAVNSIQDRYTPYHVRVPAPATASAEAAAAQAAHDVLVALIPSAKTTFDQLLASRLARISPWRALQGVAVGKKVARSIIEWRTADGFEAPNLPYAPPALPGLWQPTAPGQVAAFVQFQHTEPFGLLTPTQYLPGPPPQLNSPEYAADLTYVQEIGSINSATRTADQTQLARLVAGVGYSPGPFGLWSTVAQTVVRSKKLSLIDTARVFALLSAAMNDGLQTSHSSKFVYNLWRPITAIQRAGEDLNDQTTADPAWTPLLGTPAYPSHSSNVACIAASASRTLARLFKTDAVPFAMTWTGTGGNANVTRNYSRFSELSEQAGISRVYGGIHFRFELDASYEACTKVADFLADHYMQRRW